jgi:hypothetical protein
MRTGIKLNDGEPYRNTFFASVTYNNDLAPFQGASAGGRFPGLKPWAKILGPLRGNKLPQILLIFTPFLSHRR